MDEIGQVTDYIQDCAGEDADLIWGNGIDPSLGDAISVTVIATGFGTNSIPELYIRKRQMDKVSLDAPQLLLPKVEPGIEPVDSFEVKEQAKTRKRPVRITSYNVCYTKLLRHLPFMLSMAAIREDAR